MAEQKLLVKREGDFHYPIYLKNDFQDLAGAIREEGLENRKICIVTDSHVAPLYHEAVKSALQEISSIFLIAFDDFNLITNFTAVAATFNNIGPGLELVGPTGNFGMFSWFSKLILTFDMLAGRLEIFPLLILFVRDTWKKF